MSAFVLFDYLSLPQPIRALQAQPERSARQLRDWVIHLPAEVMTASNSLLEALSALNRRKLEHEQRAELVDILQVAIDMCFPSLEMEYQTPHWPLSDRQRLSIQRADQLLQEQAFALKLLLRPHVEKKPGWFGAGFGALAGPSPQNLIRNVLEILQRRIELAYTAHTPLDKGLWQEAHALTLWAIRHKWLDEPADPAHKRAPIGLLYKNMLLLALADPYHFEPQDMLTVRQWLRRYAGLSTFLPVTQAHQAAGYFLIRLNQDAPPQYQGQRPPNLEASTDILLNTQELTATLLSEQDKLLRSLRLRPEPTLLARYELLGRVIRQWTITPKRVFHRVVTPGSIELCVGVPAVHQLLESLAAAQEPANAQWSAHRLPEAELVTECWQVTNESPGGLAVSTSNPVAHQVQVGDFLAFRALGNSYWQMGVVRWLQQNLHPPKLELGLQILAPRALPVRLPQGDRREGLRSVPTLMLPAIPSLHQPASLIIQPGLVQEGSSLQILTRGPSMQLQTIQRLLGTRAFEQWSYRVAEGKNEAED